MASAKRVPQVWTTFSVVCGQCNQSTPAADAVQSFIAGGCETCSYSTYFIKCSHCGAKEGSDW